MVRVIQDKQPRAGRQRMPEIKEILQTVDSAAALRRFAQELRVARQIAVALRQAEGKRRPDVAEVVSCV